MSSQPRQESREERSRPYCVLIMMTMMMMLMVMVMLIMMKDERRREQTPRRAPRLFEVRPLARLPTKPPKLGNDSIQGG